MKLEKVDRNNPKQKRKLVAEIVILLVLVLALPTAFLVYKLNMDHKRSQPIIINMDEYFADNITLDVDFNNSQSTDVTAKLFAESVNDIQGINYNKPLGLYIYGNEPGYIKSEDIPYSVDWGSLKVDVLRQLSDKGENLSRSDFDQVFSIDDFDITADKYYDIYNGDQITVSAYAKAGTFDYNGITIVVTSGHHTYTVNDLR